MATQRSSKANAITAKVHLSGMHYTAAVNTTMPAKEGLMDCF